MAGRNKTRRYFAGAGIAHDGRKIRPGEKGAGFRGTGHRFALAALVPRPQAEAQIGAHDDINMSLYVVHPVSVGAIIHSTA